MSKLDDFQAEVERRDRRSTGIGANDEALINQAGEQWQRDAKAGRTPGAVTFEGGHKTSQDYSFTPTPDMTPVASHKQRQVQRPQNHLDAFEQSLRDQNSAQNLSNNVPSGSGYPAPTVPGNIQWYNRQKVDTSSIEPGTTGTVFSASRESDGYEVLFPRIYDGKLHSEDEAWEHYRKTGQHMGKWRVDPKNPKAAYKAADAYGGKYHEDAAAGLYDRKVTPINAFEDDSKPSWIGRFYDWTLDRLGGMYAMGEKKDKHNEQEVQTLWKKFQFGDSKPNSLHWADKYKDMSDRQVELEYAIMHGWSNYRTGKTTNEKREDLAKFWTTERNAEMWVHQKALDLVSDPTTWAFLGAKAARPALQWGMSVFFTAQQGAGTLQGIQASYEKAKALDWNVTSMEKQADSSYDYSPAVKDFWATLGDTGMSAAFTAMSAHGSIEGARTEAAFKDTFGKSSLRADQSQLDMYQMAQHRAEVSQTIPQSSHAKRIVYALKQIGQMDEASRNLYGKSFQDLTYEQQADVINKVKGVAVHPAEALIRGKQELAEHGLYPKKENFQNAENLYNQATARADEALNRKLAELNQLNRVAEQTENRGKLEVATILGEDVDTENLTLEQQDEIRRKLGVENARASLQRERNRHTQRMARLAQSLGQATMAARQAVNRLQLAQAPEEPTSVTVLGTGETVRVEQNQGFTTFDRRSTPQPSRVDLRMDEISARMRDIAKQSGFDHPDDMMYDLAYRKMGMVDTFVGFKPEELEMLSLANEHSVLARLASIEREVTRDDAIREQKKAEAAKPAESGAKKAEPTPLAKQLGEITKAALLTPEEIAIIQKDGYPEDAIRRTQEAAQKAHALLLDVDDSELSGLLSKENRAAMERGDDLSPNVGGLPDFAAREMMRRAAAFLEDLENIESENNLRENASELQKQAEQAKTPEEADALAQSAQEAQQQAESQRTENDARKAVSIAKAARQSDYPMGAPVEELAVGRSGRIALPDGRSLPFHYALVRVSDTIPSHDPLNSFALDARHAYDEGTNSSLLQPNDYFNNKERQERVLYRATNIDPYQIYNTAATAQEGPSIVRKDGLVAGGNSRDMMVKLVWRDGKGEVLQEAMKQAAMSMGIDPFKIPEDTPVTIVRVLDEDITSTRDLIMLGQDLNRENSFGMNKAEEGQAMALRLTPELEDWITGAADAMDEDSTIRAFMSRFDQQLAKRMEDAGIINPNRRGTYLNEDGTLTEEGKVLFEKIVRGLFFNADMVKNAPKDVLNRFDRSLFSLLRLRGKEGSWNFTPFLNDAVKLWMRVDQASELLDAAERSYSKAGEDVPSRVDLYLHPEKYKYVTQNLMGGGVQQVHPLIEALAKIVELPAKEVRKSLSEYVDDAEGKNIAMFAPPAPWESFTNHIGSKVGMDLTENDWRTINQEEAKPQTPSVQAPEEREMTPAPAPAETVTATDTAAQAAVKNIEASGLRLVELNGKQWMEFGGKYVLQFEHPDYPGWTISAYAEDLTSPDAVKKIMEQKLQDKNLKAGKQTQEVSEQAAEVSDAPAETLETPATKRLLDKIKQHPELNKDGKAELVVNGVLRPFAEKYLGVPLDEWVDKAIGDVVVGGTYKGDGRGNYLTKGFTDTLKDGKQLIALFDKADVATLAHESFHVMRQWVKPEDLAILEKAAKVTDGKWMASHEEKVAGWWERYLRDGVAPTEELKGVFQKMKAWLSEIYKTVIGTPLNRKVPDDVRAVFDKMLSGDGNMEMEPTPEPTPSEGEGKNLFIPLKTEYFNAFSDGSKATEYRAYGPRWNERTVTEGRNVVLSKGYGKYDRLNGKVKGVRVISIDEAPPAARQIYPNAEQILAIDIDVDRGEKASSGKSKLDAFEEKIAPKEMTAPPTIYETEVQPGERLEFFPSKQANGESTIGKVMNVLKNDSGEVIYQLQTDDGKEVEVSAMKGVIIKHLPDGNTLQLGMQENIEHANKWADRKNQRERDALPMFADDAPQISGEEILQNREDSNRDRLESQKKKIEDASAIKEQVRGLVSAEEFNKLEQARQVFPKDVSNDARFWKQMWSQFGDPETRSKFIADTEKEIAEVREKLAKAEENLANYKPGDQVDLAGQKSDAKGLYEMQVRGFRYQLDQLEPKLSLAKAIEDREREMTPTPEEDADIAKLAKSQGMTVDEVKGVLNRAKELEQKMLPAAQQNWYVEHFLENGMPFMDHLKTPEQRQKWLRDNLPMRMVFENAYVTTEALHPSQLPGSWKNGKSGWGEFKGLEPLQEDDPWSPIQPGLVWTGGPRKEAYDRRMKMKEMLGKGNTLLVKQARRSTLKDWTAKVTPEQAETIRVKTGLSPDDFWRAANGKPKAEPSEQQGSFDLQPDNEPEVEQFQEMTATPDEVEDKRIRRNAINSSALEDALSEKAQKNLNEMFRQRTRGRDLRHVRAAMEVFERLRDEGSNEAMQLAEDLKNSVEAYFGGDESKVKRNKWANGHEPTAADMVDEATHKGLQHLTGEEDPDYNNELLENEVFADAADAGKLIFDTLDPKTASFDLDEFNTAFGDVEFRREPDEVFPKPQNTVDMIPKSAKEKLPVMSQEEADKTVAGWKEEAKRIGATGVNKNKIVYSLFDESGIISKPWEEAGYTVRRFDIQKGQDLTDFGMWMQQIEDDIAEGYEVEGVLAQPPCTSYTLSGVRWWPTQHDVPNKEMVRKKYGDTAAELFDKPLDYANTLVATAKLFVGQADPKWYAMENPAYGRINTQNGLPKAALGFNPSNYGDPYSKQTQLWGEFNTDLPLANVEPTEGSRAHKLTGFTEEQKRLRSLTPEGFSYAFFMANHDQPSKMTAAPRETVERGEQMGFPQEEVATLPEGVMVYGSGANRVADMSGQYKANMPIGVSVNELSKNSIERLSDYARDGHPIFLDSGAFSEVEFGPEGMKVVAPITDAEWRKRLGRMKQVAKAAMDSKTPNVTVVAPDMVGSQDLTLERLAKFKDDIHDLKNYGARILVSLQLGDMDSGEFWIKANEVAGFEVVKPGDKQFLDSSDYNHEGMTPAFPMKKAAETPAGVLTFVKEFKPPSIHLLGMSDSNSKASSLIRAIREVSPETKITMDSNRIRANSDEIVANAKAERERSGSSLAREMATEKAMSRQRLKPTPNDNPAQKVESLSGLKLWREQNGVSYFRNRYGLVFRFTPEDMAQYDRSFKIRGERDEKMERELTKEIKAKKFKGEKWPSEDQRDRETEARTRNVDFAPIREPGMSSQVGDKKLQIFMADPNAGEHYQIRDEEGNVYASGNNLWIFKEHIKNWPQHPKTMPEPEFKVGEQDASHFEKFTPAPDTPEAKLQELKDEYASLSNEFLMGDEENVSVDQKTAERLDELEEEIEQMESKSETPEQQRMRLQMQSPSGNIEGVTAKMMRESPLFGGEGETGNADQGSLFMEPTPDEEEAARLQDTEAYRLAIRDGLSHEEALADARQDEASKQRYNEYKRPGDNVIPPDGPWKTLKNVKLKIAGEQTDMFGGLPEPMIEITGTDNGEHYQNQMLASEFFGIGEGKGLPHNLYTGYQSSSDYEAIKDWYNKKADELNSEAPKRLFQQVNVVARKIAMIQDKLRGYVPPDIRAKLESMLKDLGAEVPKDKEAVKREMTPAPQGASVKAPEVTTRKTRTMELWTPTGIITIQVPEEIDVRTNSPREATNDTSKLQDAGRTEPVSKQSSSVAGRESIGTAVRGVRDSGKGSGGKGTTARSSGTPKPLATVKPARVAAPVRERGEAVYTPEDWSKTVSTYNLPENLPAPTVKMNPEVARLMLPGQAPVVESILSGLKQHDATILASATGLGKAYMAGAAAREAMDGAVPGFKPKKVLFLTSSQNLVEEWIDIAHNFGVDVEKLPPGEVNAPADGVYAATYAGGTVREGFHEGKWDLILSDEIGDARRWWESQRGGMMKKLTDNAGKVVYLSATPYHTALELGHMDKLGLWREEGFDEWVKQFGAVKDANGQWSNGGSNPKLLLKLREQLIERGQFVEQPRDMRGYHPTFALFPMTKEHRANVGKINRAFEIAADWYNQRGNRAAVRSLLASRVNYLKSYIERARLPEIIELGKQAERQGYKVVFAVETRSAREELYKNLQKPDAALGGAISELMPPLPGVWESLREAFGEDIANYSGSHSEMRESEKESFNNNEKKHIFITYGAGGKGISLHDKAGDRPRYMIFIGNPWSGMTLDQAIGRPYRYNTKSDVHALFCVSDTKAEADLIIKKVAPRLASLRAIVSGIDGNDPLVQAMQTYAAAQQGAAEYELGNRHKTKGGDFDSTVKAPIMSYREVRIPDAKESFHKGMPFPGEERDVKGGASRLYQRDYEEAPSPENELPEDFETGEEREARITNNEIQRDFAENGKAPEMEAPGDLRKPERTVMGDGIAAMAESSARDDENPDATVRRTWAQESRIFNAATKAAQWAGGETGLNGFRLYMFTRASRMVNELGTKFGSPELGRKLERSIADYKVTTQNIEGPLVYRYEGIINGLSPEEHENMLFVKEGVSREVLDSDGNPVRENGKVKKEVVQPMNEKVRKAVRDLTEFYIEVHRFLAKEGIYTKYNGAKIPFAEQKLDPTYIRHAYDLEREINFYDENGEKSTVKLKDLVHGNLGESKRQQVIRDIARRYDMSPNEVEDFLAQRQRLTPLAGSLERAREVDMPFYRTDPNAQKEYLHQVAEVIARNRLFGQEGQKLEVDILGVKGHDNRETIRAVYRNLFHQNHWNEETRKMIRFWANAEVLLKMPLSSLKVPSHTFVALMHTDTRAFLKGWFHAITDYKEMKKQATISGAIIEQLKQEWLAEQGVYRGWGSKMLDWTGFHNFYKLDRIVAAEMAKTYMEDHLPQLQRGKASDRIRRTLKEDFLLNDEQIERAISAGQWQQDDYNRAMTALSNKALYTNDPSELPYAWRARDPENRGNEFIFQGIRLATLLKSYSLKTAATVKDVVWREAKAGNFRPLLKLAVVGGIVGNSIQHLQWLATANTAAFQREMEDYEKEGAPAFILHKWIEGIGIALGLHFVGSVFEQLIGPAYGDMYHAAILPSEVNKAKTDYGRWMAIKRFLTSLDPLTRPLVRAGEELGGYDEGVEKHKAQRESARKAAATRKSKHQGLTPPPF